MIVTWNLELMSKKPNYLIDTCFIINKFKLWEKRIKFIYFNFN